MINNLVNNKKYREVYKPSRYFCQVFFQSTTRSENIQYNQRSYKSYYV